MSAYFRGRLKYFSFIHHIFVSDTNEICCGKMFSKIYIFRETNEIPKLQFFNLLDSDDAWILLSFFPIGQFNYLTSCLDLNF